MFVSSGRLVHLELRLRTGWWAPREVRFVVVSLRQLVGGVTVQEAKLEEAIRLTKNIYTSLLARKFSPREKKTFWFFECGSGAKES